MTVGDGKVRFPYAALEIDVTTEKLAHIFKSDAALFFSSLDELTHLRRLHQALVDYWTTVLQKGPCYPGPATVWGWNNQHVVGVTARSPAAASGGGEGQPLWQQREMLDLKVTSGSIAVCPLLLQYVHLQHATRRAADVPVFSSFVRLLDTVQYSL